jgi:hypothetical protein
MVSRTASKGGGKGRIFELPFVTANEPLRDKANRRWRDLSVAGNGFPLASEQRAGLKFPHGSLSRMFRRHAAAPASAQRRKAVSGVFKLPPLSVCL